MYCDNKETSQARTELMTAMLYKVMTAVDRIWTKIGTIESRLLSLEGEVKNSTNSDCFVSGIELATGEALFGVQVTGGAKPKIQKPRVVESDFEILESKQR